jgi:hypothetical protein
MPQTAIRERGEDAAEAFVVCGNAQDAQERIGAWIGTWTGTWIGAGSDVGPEASPEAPFGSGAASVLVTDLAAAALHLSARPELRPVIVVRDALDGVAAALAGGCPPKEALAAWRNEAAVCLRLARRLRGEALVVDAAHAGPALSRLLGQPFDEPETEAEARAPATIPGFAALAALAVLQDPEVGRLRDALAALLHPPGRREPDLARLQDALLAAGPAPEAELESLRAERDRLEAEANRHFREAARLTWTLDSRLEALEAERDAARARAAEIDGLKALLDEETARFYTSWSWRVTAPLRAVRRLAGR